ncbi:hypothetical protein BU089_11260 [Staphylococcus warneri]|nr:hypothetical protein SHTS_02635 [Staphylococcus haemolyticus]OHR04724.1 hypothetical protein HMPREF2740_04275 [Staphylococcus sp. HMSC078A03]OIS41905.1 hypothetical protein A4A23_11340 [Staphylococcus warneri]OIS43635.1 hypothetical protein A4A24_11105 [Staphylococcus warneri]PNY85001.1 hypothetical protein CD037_05550 [Staphylococcus haemolyticus]
MGTTQYLVGTFWVQNKKMYTFLKSLYPLKCLASPDLPFKMVANFPYALTKNLEPIQNSVVF